MSYRFYLADYGPVTASVLDTDDITPLLPVSGTATIVNQHSGATIVTNASCDVDLGTITYMIPPSSPITATSARYVAYLTAEIDAETKLTTAIPLEVLDKASYLVVDRWRNKVEYAAPSSAPDGSDAVSDEQGREWVDQAVALINRYFSTGYTSVLGSITPAATPNDLEFIAHVASLMARTAWWAGKGDWRDDEMSFNAGPFQIEWSRVFAILNQQTTDDWFTDDYQTESFNRDRVFYPGYKIDSELYWRRRPTDPVPQSEFPL